MRGKFALGLLAGAFFGLIAGGVSAANADTIFQSAINLRDGVSTNNSGLVIDTDFYTGANFYISNTTVVTSIGGNFYNWLTNGNNEVFGAIVPVSGQNGVPTPYDLSSHVLGTTLITLPTQETNSDVSGNLTLTLQPGWYAELFGSGRFGATAHYASAIITREDGPANQGLTGTYGIRQSDGTVFTQAPGARFFVDGAVVPLPPAVGSGGVLLMGAGCVAAWRRRGVARAGE